MHNDIIPKVIVPARGVLALETGLFNVLHRLAYVSNKWIDKLKQRL